MTNNKTKKKNTKLGSLVASAELALHSIDTLRLWNPSKKSKSLGAGVFFSRASTLEYAARQDDPYADYALLVIENALDSAMRTCQEIEAALPVRNTSRVSYHEALSRDPITKTIKTTARFGWRFVDLIEQFDITMVRLSDASFKAQITRKETEDYRSKALAAIRNVITLSVQMQHSGITRHDVASNNAKAQAAQEKLGAIPLEVLEGIERAQFAPEINA